MGPVCERHDVAACLQVPTECSGVPAEILNPASQWGNQGEFDSTLGHLADLYTVRPPLLAQSSLHEMSSVSSACS